MPRMKVSPAITLDLADRIESAIMLRYGNGLFPDDRMERYIRRWYEEDYRAFGESNFTIFTERGSGMNLTKTLDSMQDELLFQIAVDLGIEVPGLIYSVAEIRGLLATRNEDAGMVFDKALKGVYSDPNTSIVMANSALERIIKEISKKVGVEGYKDKHTLYDQMLTILKALGLHPNKDLDQNLRQIGSGLITVSQAVEGIRSRNTHAHGTVEPVIQEPLYAMFIINTAATVGLFLLNYAEKIYPFLTPDKVEDDVPF